MWDRRRATAFLKNLERHLNGVYHVALAGGVLLRGESAHDLDVLVYPHTTRRAYKRDEVRSAMTWCGFHLVVPSEVMHQHWREAGSTDRKQVEVWTDHSGRRVDVIMVR